MSDMSQKADTEFQCVSQVVQDLIDDGQPATALKLIEGVIRSDPSRVHSDTVEAAVKACDDECDLKIAIEVARHYQANCGGSDRPMKAAAEVAERHGQYGYAIDQWNWIHTNSRSHAEQVISAAKLVTLYVATDNWDQAELLARSLEAESALPQTVQRIRLDALREVGHLRTRASLAVADAKVRPKNAAAQIDAADSLLDLNDIDGAVVYLTQALSYFRDPKKPVKSINRVVDVSVRALGVRGAGNALSTIDTYSCNVERRGSGFDKEYLFVSGLPRSGTTALGSLLNLSPDIALFVELYGYQRPYSPGCFDEAVVRERLRGHRHERKNEEILEKSRCSRFLGDKRPNFIWRYPETMLQFERERVHIVHVMRSIEAVCASYQRRAEDPGDQRWTRARDFRRAIQDWNVTLGWVVDVLEERAESNANIIFVNYANVLTKHKAAMGVFRDVGCQVDARLEASVSAFTRKSERRIGRVECLNQRIKDAISREVRWDLMEFVERRLAMRLSDNDVRPRKYR